MGVVHKLRDDVVDFILAQKKERPDISVRKLSAVVLKEFQIVVSKSSVSSVLKNANLNSPIGRHGSSVDEAAGFVKKPASTFKIPEQKKKQIFLSGKPSVPPPPVKTVKTEHKPEVKPLIVIKPLPVKVEEVKPALAVSNLKAETKVPAEVIKSSFEHAGMIFLKAAEWDLAGGSVLAKILKDELGGRYDIDYEFLADLLLFPELFDQKISSGDDSRRIGKLLSASAQGAPFNPQIFSAAMAAVNHIENCGLKLAIELEILLRGVSSAKITDRSGTSVFYNLKNKVLSLDNVQSEDTVSVDEAVKGLNIDIVKNVQSAVFHCFLKANALDQLVKFLLGSFRAGPEGGFREASLLDASGVELAKYTYFPAQKRTFVLAVWSWKERWPEILGLAARADFKALPAFGKTFYYADIGGDQFLNSKNGALRVIVLSTAPAPSEEPLVVLLTNVDGDGEKVKGAVFDFLYSWPGLTEESAPYFMAENAGQKDPLPNVFKELEAQPAFSQCLPTLRKFLDNWSQHHFFASKGNPLDDRGTPEQFYRLPGRLRNENERVSAVTLEAPANHPSIEQLKNAVRRFNARMFRGVGGRRIFLKLSSPAN
ncbi:MAG: hypothetical protein IT395_00100 [Candidatus Omnitrophica bacterium]|nr:hypothetical protein [Candidatus Omnitrophota bacterium]